jgi:hypothetical protein
MAKGILKTELRQANGNPTLHFKLERKAFIDAFGSFLTKAKDAIVTNQPIDCTKRTIPLCEKNHSITDTTTDTTSETTLLKKGEKGGAPGKSHHYALSFNSYKKRYDVNPTMSDVIEHFLAEYESRFGERHPRLRPEQWSECIYQLSNSDLCLDGQSIEDAADIYFDVDYQDGCDYRLMHFSAPGVQEMLGYRLMYGD